MHLITNNACPKLNTRTYYMQQWYMDYSKASRVTNNNGQRAFALVNKASGQALVNKDNKLADGCIQVSI